MRGTPQPFIATCLLVILSSLSLCLNASTEMVMSVSQSSQGEEAQQITLSIQDKSLRVDGTVGDSNKNSQQMVYNGLTNTLIMIDHNQRSYTAIDQATIEAIAARMNAAKKQMEAQMAEMPPEQRQMMEKMMKGRMPMSGVQEPQETEDFRKTSGTSTAGGYECTVTEVFSGGNKVREYCVTPWAKIKGADEISATFTGMTDLFTKMLKSLSQSVPMDMKLPFSEMQALDGFPVIVTNFKGNAVTEVTRLISIDEKSFPDNFFDVPGGYKKQEMIKR